jgi:hypothetical protein
MLLSVLITGTGRKSWVQISKLHYMDVPYSELYRPLEKRNRDLPEGAFEIPEAEMDISRLSSGKSPSTNGGPSPFLAE